MSAPPAHDGATGPAASEPGSRQLAEIGRVTLAGRAENVRQARHFITDLLSRDWPRLDDVLTLASEVVSNAITHTKSGEGGYFEVTVAVCVTGNRVRIEVADQGGPSAPRPREADNEAADPGLATSGRGLRIVGVLADQWGHHGDDQGRVIWFEITAKPEPGTAADLPRGCSAGSTRDELWLGE